MTTTQKRRELDDKNGKKITERNNEWILKKGGEKYNSSVRNKISCTFKSDSLAVVGKRS